MNYKNFIFSIIFTLNSCNFKYKNINIKEFKEQVYICMQHIFYQEHTYSFCKSGLKNIANRIYVESGQELDYFSENLYPNFNDPKKYFTEFLVFLLQKSFNEKIFGLDKYNIDYNKINLNDIFELDFNFDFEKIYSVFRKYRNNIVLNLFKKRYNTVNDQTDYYAVKKDTIDIAMLGDTVFSLIFLDFYKDIMTNFFNLYYENSYFITCDKYYKNIFYEQNPNWVLSADEVFDEYDMKRPDYTNIVGYSEDCAKYSDILYIGKLMPVNLIKKERLKTEKKTEPILYFQYSNEIFKVLCFDIFLLIEKDCVFGEKQEGVFGKKENKLYIFNKDSQLPLLIKFWELIISYFCMIHTELLINEREMVFYDYIRSLSLDVFTYDFQKKINNDFGEENVKKWIKQLKDCCYQEKEGSVTNYENIKNFLKKSFKNYYDFRFINNEKKRSQLTILNTKFSFFFSYLRFFWSKNFDSFVEEIDLNIDSFALAFDNFYTKIIEAISKHKFLLKNNSLSKRLNQFRSVISLIYAIDKLVYKFIEEYSNINKINEEISLSLECRDKNLEKILSKDFELINLKECIEKIKKAKSYTELNQYFEEFLMLLVKLPEGKRDKETNEIINDNIRNKVELIKECLSEFKKSENSDGEKIELGPFVIYYNQIFEMIRQNKEMEILLEENDDEKKSRKIDKTHNFINEICQVESEKYNFDKMFKELKRIAQKYGFSLLPFEDIVKTNITRDFNQGNFKESFDRLESTIEIINKTKIFDSGTEESIKICIYSQDHTYRDKIIQKCFYENPIVLNFLKHVYFFIECFDQDPIIEGTIIKINNKISELKKFLENEEEKLVNLIDDLSLFSDINVIKYSIDNSDELIILDEYGFIGFVESFFQYLNKYNIIDEIITKIILLEFVNYIKIFIQHNNEKNIIEKVIKIVNTKISELKKEDDEKIKYFIEVLRKLANYNENKDLEKINDNDRERDNLENQNSIISTYREIKDIIKIIKDSYEKLNYYKECVKNLKEKNLLFLVEQDLKKMNSVAGMFSFYVETFFIAQKIEIFDLDILNDLFLESIKQTWYDFFSSNLNFICEKFLERVSEFNYSENFTEEDVVNFVERKKDILKKMIFNYNYKQSFNMTQTNAYYDILISLPKENCIFFQDYYDYLHRAKPNINLNLSYKDYFEYILEPEKKYILKKINLKYKIHIVEKRFFKRIIHDFFLPGIMGINFWNDFVLEESIINLETIYEFKDKGCMVILNKIIDLCNGVRDYILSKHYKSRGIGLDFDYVIKDTILINNEEYVFTNSHLNLSNLEKIEKTKEDIEKIKENYNNFIDLKRSYVTEFIRNALFSDKKVKHFISDQKKIKLNNSDYPQEEVVKEKLCFDKDVADTIEIYSFITDNVFSLFEIFSVVGFTIEEIYKFQFPFKFKVDITNDKKGAIKILYRLNTSQIDYLHFIEGVMSVIFK